MIRSKGVGVFFITQNPADVPDDVLSQLGNRVQQALRALTAKDHKDLKLAVETYRENPKFDTAEAIQEVGTSEAVTSLLDEGGTPTVVERTQICLPSSQLGSLDRIVRDAMIDGSEMAAKYNQTLDRESAIALLKERAVKAAKQAEEAEAAEAKEREFKQARRYDGGQAGRSTSWKSSKSGGFGDAIAKVVVKELKGATGRRIVRGILVGLFKDR